MGNYKQGGNRGEFKSSGKNGERGFQRKSFGDDRGNKEQMMHKAICSECNKNCEVPFRPTNGKPVYCKDCFGSKGNRNESDFHKKEYDRVPARIHYDNKGSDDGVKKQLLEVNMKLDRLIKALDVFIGVNVKPILTEAKKEEKKSVDVIELKKVLDMATKKESIKTKAVKKEAKVTAKKVTKKETVAKKKK